LQCPRRQWAHRRRERRGGKTQQFGRCWTSRAVSLLLVETRTEARDGCARAPQSAKPVGWQAENARRGPCRLLAGIGYKGEQPLMVLCCDPLAIALTAAASARRSTDFWSVALSIAAVLTPSTGTAAVGHKRSASQQYRLTQTRRPGRDHSRVLQSRSSTAENIRSRWFHHMAGGILPTHCQTGVAMCQSVESR
jgi:hypothetical protein